MGGVYSFYFKQEIFDWLIAPADGLLSPQIEGFDGKPVYGKVTGMMAATLAVVAKGAMLTALPVVLYSVLSLIRPWLPVRFWRFLTFLTIAVTASYFAGIVFVYYVMLPVGLGFLLNFGSGIAVAVIDIGDYLALVTALMSAMGMVFLIPTMMFLFSKLVRFPKYRHWKWGRWAVPIFAGFLGMILTPSTDTVNFLMVGLPVIALYEIGLFATWVIDPSEGNYLWIKTIARWLRGIRNAVVWVARRPVVALRRVRRYLLKHGLDW
jgi:sec-independent protein translocase protein TatC